MFHSDRMRIDVSSVTSADGTSIDYDAYGDGPGVVFVGGAVQHRLIDPGPTAAAQLLAGGGRRAVAYDRRGRGRSGDTQPWAIEREVEDVAALIGVCGGSAVLFAVSAGGAVALAAATAKVGVSGLILYEPPFFAGAGKADQIATVRELVAAGRNEDAMRYNLTDVVGMPAHVVAGIQRSPSWPAMCAVAPTLVYDLTAVDAVNTDPDWVTRWSPVEVPVEVYSGANSFPALASAADAVAAAIPDSRRRTLVGESHNPAPDAIVHVVEGFGLT